MDLASESRPGRASREGSPAIRKGRRGFMEILV
jgi:hypothetical protein